MIDLVPYFVVAVENLWNIANGFQEGPVEVAGADGGMGVGKLAEAVVAGGGQKDHAQCLPSGGENVRTGFLSGIDMSGVEAESQILRLDLTDKRERFLCCPVPVIRPMLQMNGNVLMRSPLANVPQAGQEFFRGAILIAVVLRYAMQRKRSVFRPKNSHLLEHILDGSDAFLIAKFQSIQQRQIGVEVQAGRKIDDEP